MIRRWQGGISSLWKVLIGLALLVLVACGGQRQGAVPSFSGVVPPTSAPVGAQPDIPANPDWSTPQSVPGITLTVRAAYGGIYRVGSWVPIQITVQNDGRDISAQVQVSSNRDATNYATALDLPGGSRKSATIYVFMPTLTQRLVVRLIADDQRLAQEPLTLEPYRASDHIVASISGTGVELRIPAQLSNGVAVRTVPVAMSDLSDDVAGLTTFDTIVLDDVPTTELSDAQRNALYAWVLRGGQLVVAGGAGAERTLAGLPEPLRAVRVMNTTQVPANTVLAASTAADNLPLVQLEPRNPTATTDQTYPINNSALQVQPGNPPLLLEQGIGNGVVTFAALPLLFPAMLRWSEQAVFWSELLRPRQTLMPGFGPSDMRTDSFIEGNIASLLTGLPALEFPPMQTLGLLLLLYILLVGPGTYLLLRRLDRQILGWVLIPGLTLIFAAIVYSLGYAQRGGDVVVNEVTLLEPLDSGTAQPSMARVRSFVGIFSPNDARYALELSSSEPANTMTMVRPVSLQGPWDNSTLPQGGIFVQEQGLQSVASVADLQIPQWSMRALLADQIRPYAGLQATVTLDGTTLSGEVINRGTETLYDVVLAQGNQIAFLGDLAPGAQGRTLLERRNPVGNGAKFSDRAPLSYLIYGTELEKFNNELLGPPPPELLLRVRFLDAIYSAGPVARGTQPVLIAWMQSAPLLVDVAGKRVTRQQLTLVTFTPQLQVVGSTVTLGQNWLERRIEQAPDAACAGGQGLGVNLFSAETVVMSLSLPRPLARFQPSAMTLLTTADGAWPAEIGVALFDWQQGIWVPQERGSGSSPVVQPERFLGSNGKILAQISGQVTPQNNPGCLYIDAVLEGQLP